MRSEITNAQHTEGGEGMAAVPITTSNNGCNSERWSPVSNSKTQNSVLHFAITNSYKVPNQKCY